MRKSEKLSVIYILKFIAFVLLFVIIGNGIGLLWRYIGEASEKSAQNVSAVRDRATVVIDAGHGGRDGGAVALSKISEKDLNLDVSLALAEMLRGSGVNVVLTRDGDYMLSCDEGSTNKGRDLAARRRIIQSQENAIFVSIHMNSFPQAEYKGLQVYYSENNELSKRLAETVQSYTVENLQKNNKRQTKMGRDIYLLETAECPAILVECGFLTNPEEAELLNNAEYRRKLALILCAAVCDFLGEASD